MRVYMCVCVYIRVDVYVYTSVYKHHRPRIFRISIVRCHASPPPPSFPPGPLLFDPQPPLSFRPPPPQTPCDADSGMTLSSFVALSLTDSRWLSRMVADLGPPPTASSISPFSSPTPATAHCGRSRPLISILGESLSLSLSLARARVRARSLSLSLSLSLSSLGMCHVARPPPLSRIVSVSNVWVCMGVWAGGGNGRAGASDAHCRTPPLPASPLLARALCPALSSRHLPPLRSWSRISPRLCSLVTTAAPPNPQLPPLLPPPSSPPLSP